MVYLFGEFRFDSGQGLLFRSEIIVPLKPKSIAVLGILLENHGQLVEKETLISRVWPDAFVEDNNLNQCIAVLRRALGDDRNGTQYIQTIVKRGFRFAGHVTIEATSDNIRQEIVKPATEVPSLEIFPVTASSDRTEISGSQPTPSVIEHRVPRWHARLSFKALLVVGLLILIYYLPARTSAPQTPEVLGYTQVTHDGRKKSVGLPLFAAGAGVYFREDRRGGWALASAPIEGGDVAGVPLPPGFHVTDVSRSGSLFLGDERGANGVLDLVATAGAAKPINWLMPSPESGEDRRWLPGGSWSPRGNRIAVWIRNDIFEANADGSAIQKIAHLDGWPDRVRWSPDGRKLVFSVLKPKAEKFALWEMNADGTNLHALSFPGYSFTETCCGVWMPDGKYLIFEVDRHEIWAVREKKWFWSGEPKPVRLTSGPLNYHWPVPSRDGREIFVLGEEVRGELMRFDLKTHTFAEFLGGVSAAEVSFSRDGKWVAYVSYPDYTLWRARADGSDAMQLTFPPLEAREPHWSPDGKQIAFQGIRTGPRYKIYIVPAAGGPAREAIPGNGEESVGTWSPDGRSLFYDEPLYRDPISQMFVRRLNPKTGKTYTIPGTAGSWTARLSPDGRYIATLEATPAANPHRLFILDAATGQRVRTIKMLEQLHEPTWSRDGRYVYFATLDPPAPALYRVRLRDEKLEKLASLKGFPVAGVWTGVAPDGSPLLLRDISTQEIYALRVRLP